jgi:hypothetical protein
VTANPQHPLRRAARRRGDDARRMKFPGIAKKIFLFFNIVTLLIFKAEN